MLFPRVEKKDTGPKQEKGRSWLFYAAGSAVFASLTSILGKVGISGVESNLGTAIRTGVVLVMAWVMVFVTGKQHTIDCFFKLCLPIFKVPSMQRCMDTFFLLRNQHDKRPGSV